MARRARLLLRTLRGRLVLVLVGATAVGLFIMGLTSVALLNRSLMARVDDRLAELSRPWEEGDHPPPKPPRPPDGRGPRDLPTDFRVLFFDQVGNPTGDVLGPSESDPSRPLLVRRDLAPGTSTVPDSVGGSHWRVRTVTLPNGGTIALALPLNSVDATVQQLILIEVAVGAVVIVALAAVATVTVRLGLRPLTRIEHTAHAIATGELDRRIPDQDPHTETGRLGDALNTMLGRLVAALHQREQSEHRLRRFAADASHELRTPLTSIRGFAELYRRSDDPKAADVRSMMSRIEDEAVRMTALVEDLLLLARMDRERAIDLVDLELVPLVQDVAHDGRVRDPEREITVRTPDRAVRVLGEGHRLRQALTNLLTNALVHTAPGTPVTVTVEHGVAGGADVAAAGVDVTLGTPMGVVEVSDSGPGITVEHAHRIFDRFYRVDDGRSQGGSGLGLAIVAAIAEAHNGRVELAANSTGGSTFRLLIPLS